MGSSCEPLNTGLAALGAVAIILSHPCLLGVHPSTPTPLPFPCVSFFVVNRRLLAAHGIISPMDADLPAGSSGGGSAAAGAGVLDDPEQQQPLLQQQEEEEGHEGGSYCKVFSSLSAGARYAEDRCVSPWGAGVCSLRSATVEDRVSVC